MKHLKQNKHKILIQHNCELSQTLRYPDQLCLSALKLSLEWVVKFPGRGNGMEKVGGS